jgi:predicted P-loop ATPase
MHSLTVLSYSSRHAQTKNLKTGETYSKTKRVLGSDVVRFKRLRDLVSVLQLLAAEPNQCVIRGQLRRDAPTPLRRRKSHFDDKPVSWVMLDIDSLRLPKHLRSVPYTAEHAAFAASSLPAEFSGVSCVWQASASAGVDARQLKMHLWFVLDRPLTAAQLRVWLRGAAIDHSTLKSTQPHYTAAPLGADSVYVGERVGLMRGALKRVPVPDIGAAQEYDVGDVVPQRKNDCVDVARETEQKLTKQAERRARLELENCVVGYESALKIGAILGPSVALKTWNDAEHGHETWKAHAATSAEEWGRLVAEARNVPDSAEYYGERVLTGIKFGVIAERNRRNELTLAQVSATKAVCDKLLRQLGANAGSLSTLQKVGKDIGKRIDTSERKAVLAKMQTESGFSEQQCSEALAAGEAEPIDKSAWRDGLVMTGKLLDVISDCDSNLRSIFANHPDFQSSFRRNVRTRKLEAVEGNALGIEAGVPNPGYLPGIILDWLSGLGCKMASLRSVRAVLDTVAVTEYDPFLELFPEVLYTRKQARKALKSVEPKLDTWLTDHFGCADTELNRLFASKTLIAAAARAARPGEQVDSLLVLQGGQGIGKTSVVRTLGQVIGKLGYQELLNIHDKDDVLRANQGLCVEVSELKATRKDIEATKAFISRMTDRIRSPYGHVSEDFDRRVVFIGTTNILEFLTDDENRRYWPVECTKRCLMTQEQATALWREAALRYAAGELWYLQGAEEQLQVDASKRYRSVSSVEECLKAWLKDKTQVSYVAISEAVRNTCERYVSDQDIAAALRVMRWRSKRIGPSKRSVWVRPGR